MLNCGHFRKIYDKLTAELSGSEPFSMYTKPKYDVFHVIITIKHGAGEEMWVTLGSCTNYEQTSGFLLPQEDEVISLATFIGCFLRQRYTLPTGVPNKKRRSPYPPRWI